MMRSVMRTNEVCDVLIIGAGPAGSSAAKAVSKGGLTAILLEKEKLPRYKMCSGMLGPTSMAFVAEHFGQIPKEAMSAPYEVEGLCVHKAIGEEPLHLSFDVLDPGEGHRMGCSVKRPEFDHWLAVKSGVSILDGTRVLKVEVQEEATTVIAERNGIKRALKAKYIIGADGPLSVVRKSLKPDFDKSLRLIPNYEEWYVGDVGLQNKWLHCFYDPKVTSFFATLFNKDGKIVVVTGSKQSESTKEYFQNFVAYLEKNHGLVLKEKTATYGCVLHDMSATDNFYLGNGNVLLAGEAGGFNRCAEGISSALITGKAAGDAVIQSAETGLPAIGFYTDGAAPEAEVCKMASAMIEQTLGFNPFTR